MHHRGPAARARLACVALSSGDCWQAVEETRKSASQVSSGTSRQQVVWPWLQVNSIHDAVVERVQPYGIFVRLRGFRKFGLVHSSQVFFVDRHRMLATHDA